MSGLSQKLTLPMTHTARTQVLIQRLACTNERCPLLIVFYARHELKLASVFVQIQNVHIDQVMQRRLFQTILCNQMQQGFAVYILLLEQITYGRRVSDLAVRHEKVLEQVLGQLDVRISNG